MEMGMSLAAGLWGWLAASSLLLGAVVGVYVRLPRVAVASVMAYGSGVLVAAICFDQLPDALELGGHFPALAGMLSGGLIFTLASRWLDHLQSGGRGAMLGLLIAAGAFLDGIPESLGLGLGLLKGGQISLVMLAAIFLSNLPEGLASAVSLRSEGRSTLWIFALWGVIVLLSGLAAMAGPAFFGTLPDAWLAFALGFSAGAVLCMLVDSMIPEAFAVTHALTGLITLAGFMTALALDKLF